MQPISILHKIFPFLQWRHLVNASNLKHDIMAGLTGALIVLPQGVVFAQIAGLPPEYGLYTAIITPVIASLFGSSWHMISGPTTALSIVIMSTLSGYAEPFSPEFVQLVFSMTLMVGVFQLILGLVRMGSLVNFVSHTVIVGFTAGAAILIAIKQFKHVLGIDIAKGLSFQETIQALGLQIGETNLYVLLIALVTLGSSLVFRRFLPRWSYMLLAMVLGSVLCFLIGGEEKGVILIDNISVSLPPPLSMPFFSWETFSQIASDAFAVALLGLIEAVAIARSIATKTNQRIDGNQEFIGQGLSNIVGSFFSCYAGSGSFTRTGVNRQAGGRTPLAAIFAAIFLVLVLLLIAPLMSYLPMAVMGGIILLVAYTLIDFDHIKEIIHLSKTETAILLVTFLATLLIELEFAIYIGVILSLITYLQKTAKPKIVELAPEPEDQRHRFSSIEKYELPTCPQLKVIRIDGSLFFGAVQYVAGQLHHLSMDEPKTLLIVGDGMNFIDMSGADLLVNEVKRWREAGGDIYFCKLKDQVSSFLERGDFLETIGKDHIFATKREAIAVIYDQLDQGICANCTARIFEECKT